MTIVHLSLSSNSWKFSWNSAIFTSIPIVAIPRATVTSDHLTSPDIWRTADPLGHLHGWREPAEVGEAFHNKSPIYALQDRASNMVRLSPAQCAERYISPTTVTTSLIIVAGNTTYQQNNASSLLDGWISAWGPWAESTGWICAAFLTNDELCDRESVERFSARWKVVVPKSVVIDVDHCLVGEEGNNEERCALHYSAHILGIVGVCTLMESILVLLVWFLHRRDSPSKESWRNRTMVTIGDAIQSYLERPAAELDVADGGEPDVSSTKSGHVVPKKSVWRTQKAVSWIRAVSSSDWIMSYIM